MKRVSIVAAGLLSAAVISRDGWALGLGELALFSYLNEPFRAEVALLEADSLDDKDVHVGLASDAEFERLGVSRDFLLTRIKFEIEGDGSGRRVVLTTEAPLREPYLDFVVEARWPDGRLLREYTVFIDLPPRPLMTERQGHSAAPENPSDEQTMLADTGTASTNGGGYANEAAMRPTPGAQYLVTNADTLWRIASEGAPAGVSVEQTMLEIVAANPTAFQGGNINGLKSGYVLQIPDAEDIQIDLATAMDEVVLQNEEWAQGVTRQSQGLTLVADAETETETETEEASDPLGDRDTFPEGVVVAQSDADPADEASSDVSAASSAQELETLIATVSRLRESLGSLEAQLAQRDAEVASLRSALAEQQAATPVPIVVETAPAPVAPSVPEHKTLPLWPFFAGFAMLLAGGGLLIWRRKRQNAEPLDLVDPKRALPAEGIEEASVASRLSDPQIMASKVVEEAQIYIAYGRTDQAVEVLSDALAEGLTSVSLNMCLLECYVELEQFSEAGALLGRLEQGGNPDLLERARQMLLDAGMTLTSSVGDAVAEHQEERIEESDEISVLSELSFSTDPAFDLSEGQDAGSETEWVESAPVPEEPALEQVGAEEHILDRDAFDEHSLDESVTIIEPEDRETEFEAVLPLTDDEQGLQLAPLEDKVDDSTLEVGVNNGERDETSSDAAASPDTSGLSLTPLDAEANGAETPIVEDFDMDESIYGVETNPVDSKLDLARAYLDMGDEDGARPVLMEVIKEGDLAQQAEARELLLRLEAS